MPGSKRPIDDSKATVIRAVPVKSGRQLRTLYPTRADVLMDPDGQEYVRGAANERADLIYGAKNGVRLRFIA